MRKKRLSVLAVVALILSLGIGFAALQSTLTINGHTKISGNNWDIHFENVVPKQGSVNGQVTFLDGDGNATENTSGVSLEFTADLKAPGEFYEFTVDIKNAGTIDAAIYQVEATDFSQIKDTSGKSVSDYLDYQIYYVEDADTGYNGTFPAITNTLFNKDKAYNTRKLKVRVKYKDGVLDDGTTDPNFNMETSLPSVDSVQTTNDETGETVDNRIQTRLTLYYTQLGYECKLGECPEQTTTTHAPVTPEP